MNCKSRLSLLFLFQFLFLSILLLMLFILAGCGGKKESEQSGKAVAVTVMTVVPRDIPVEIQFVGTTESSHQVEIRSRVEGFLEKISYEEGGRVKAGQTMFQIDKRPFEAALQQARGFLHSSRPSWSPLKRRSNEFVRWLKKTPSARKTLTMPSAMKRRHVPPCYPPRGVFRMPN